MRELRRSDWRSAGLEATIFSSFQTKSALHSINLVLWMAMVGAAFAPRVDQSTRTVAVIGLVMAALWQHAAIRGGWRAKETKPGGQSPG